MNPISEGYDFSQNQDLINTAKFKVQTGAQMKKSIWTDMQPQNLITRLH